MNILLLANRTAQASRLVSAACRLNGTISLLCPAASPNEFCALEGVARVLHAPDLPASPLAQAHALLDLAREYDHILCAEDEQPLLAMLGALLQRPVLSKICEIIDPDTAKRTCHAGQFIATLRATRSFLAVQTSAFPPCSKRPDPVEAVKIQLQKTQDIQRVLHSQAVSGQHLETAKIVVGGGKGLGDQVQFERLLKPLASLLNAEIGGTRSAAEAGMIDHAAQIGQTGHSIAPELYLAIGISGAAQHVAGIRHSRIIIAINPDPDAPIFKVADYGWLAQAQEALPALAQALTARLASGQPRPDQCAPE